MKIFHCHASSKSTFFKRSCQESPGIVCWLTNLSFSAQRCLSGDVYLSISFNSCTGSIRFAQDTWGFLARTVWTIQQSPKDPCMIHLCHIYLHLAQKIDGIHVGKKCFKKRTSFMKPPKIPNGNWHLWQWPKLRATQLLHKACHHYGDVNEKLPPPPPPEVATSERVYPWKPWWDWKTMRQPPFFGAFSGVNSRF